MANEKLSLALQGLANIEDELEACDKKVQNYRLSVLQPVYNKRNALIQDVPDFWKIVLTQHQDFADYIQVEDFKYVENISSIEIDWESIDEFQITFNFQGIEDDFPKQKVCKKFKLEYDVDKVYNPNKLKPEELEDMEEFGYWTSEPCAIQWPASYNGFNPAKIMDKSSAIGKKNYRKGMKSFFGWFKWTGLKIGKEFPNGQDLATLFTDDIYPHCLKYYTQAHRDLEDERDGTDSEVDDEEEPAFEIPEEVDEDEEEEEEEQEPASKKVKKG